MSTTLLRALVIFQVTILGFQSHAASKAKSTDQTKASCSKALSESEIAAEALPKAEATANKTTVWSLDSFLSADPEKNLALKHPFTIANAAEKIRSMIMHEAPVRALDPLFRVKPITIYPMLSTGHPASWDHKGPRMVIGQEESIDAFVKFVDAAARGNIQGKTLGFPGPPGTGKTELLTILSNIERNLDREDKYRQLSYRWKNLHEIPYLKHLFSYDRDGKPVGDVDEKGKPVTYLNPDMPRSPFTLLREDIQSDVLKNVLPQIRTKFNMVISKGWTEPEPKSALIIRAILEHHFPKLREGGMSVEDIPADQYMELLNKHLVIVSKRDLKKSSGNVASLIRVQTDSPNYNSLFASPNMLRMSRYGLDNALGVDFNGLIFQQDGGLLMFDEFYRNPPEFLNLGLEIVQNHVAQTDYGAQGVLMDVVTVWNANDESIEQAKENNALKASLDRTQRNPMRLLLPPNQISAVSLFQVNINKFKMRKLGETEIQPFDYLQVFPLPDQRGMTATPTGRYAIYYDTGTGRDLQIAPHALEYMSWLASASRFNVDMQKLSQYKDELNLVTSRPEIFRDAVTRLKIALGERTAEAGELRELSRVFDLLKEGDTGISSRDVETWFNEAINIALSEGRDTLTPRTVDRAFHKLLDRGEISPPKAEVRAYWQALRNKIKLEVLLPRLDRDVKALASGDSHRAERIYDQIEKEFITVANNPEATHVTPEDGSQAMPVNRTRLNEIMQLYRERWQRDFSPNMLLLHLRDAREGSPKRDSELLETIRLYIAKHDAATADYISALNGYYHQGDNDPAIRQRASEIEPRLADYGYSPESFKEAVAFVEQMRTVRMVSER